MYIRGSLKPDYLLESPGEFYKYFDVQTSSQTLCESIFLSFQVILIFNQDLEYAT